MLSIFFSRNYWASVFVLAKSYIHKQYKHSILGSAWSLIPHFVQITVMSYVFTSLFQQPAKVMIVNLSVGIPMWGFLSSSLNSGALAFLSREAILKKTMLSRTIYPLSDLLVQLYNFFMSLFTMYTAALVLYPEVFSYKVLYLPIVIAPFLITVFSIAVSLSFLTPYVRDIPQIVQVLLSVFYWSVPIVYPYSMIPVAKRFIFEINPLFLIFSPVQTLLTQQIVPDFFVLFKAGLVALFSMTISYVTYKFCSRSIIFYL